MERKFSFNKKNIKILLLEGVHRSTVETFASSGYSNVEYHSGALEKVELEQCIRDAHIVGIRSRTFLDESILKKANKLFAIGCFSIGTNQVDLSTAKNLGIPVFNAPFSNTRSVAELVIAEAIMLMREVPAKNAAAHKGKWLKSAQNSFEVRGKTLGIVGYGHIGSQVSILAESLGMNVLYFDIEKKLTLGNAKPCNTLDEVLENSDVVTLHVPETDLTRNMISEQQIRKMKPGTLLINASRGTVVDYNALAGALRSAHLAGAAADVFPVEPVSAKEEFRNVLQEFDNVILTPHIGGSTTEAQENIGLEVSEKIIRYSDTGSTLGAVNFPQISLFPNKTTQRFLHIHKNLPGMMKEINLLFTGKGVNISAQYLQTDNEIGYVITDTESNLGTGFLNDLRRIPNTIRARMLY
jgi:D-3-phosphoglycerate dehydrogenase